MALATMLVGEEETTFQAVASHLCAVSNYFQAALHGCFKESKEQVLRLPEVSAETFSCFLEWLYCRLVMGPSGDYDPQAWSNESLLGFYKFADRYDVAQFKWDVLAVLTEKTEAHSEAFSAAQIADAYENLPEKDDLFLTLLENFLHHNKKRTMSDEDKQRLPQAFLIEVAAVFLRW
jgi:hypothetical protein